MLREIRIESFNSIGFCGYEQKTTLYEDFSIAEAFGLEGLEDTFGNAFSFCTDSAEYITELALVMNWKSWRHYEENYELGEWYSDKYYKVREWAFENLSDEDLTYYIRTTD